MMIWRAEWHRGQGTGTSIIVDPFGFTRKLLLCIVATLIVQQMILIPSFTAT